MRWSVLVVTLLAPLLLWAVLPVGSLRRPHARAAAEPDQRKQALIGGHKAHERVLTTDISALDAAIDSLQGDITTLSAKQQKLQTEPGRQARAARRGPDQPARRAGPADPPARPPGRGRAARSPTAWSRSTRPTSRTSSPSCSSPTASTTCSSAPSSCGAISHQDAHIMDLVSDAKAESTATAKQPRRAGEPGRPRWPSDRGPARPGLRRALDARRPARPRSPTARAAKQTLLASSRRPPPEARGRRRPRSRPRRRRSRPSCASSPAPRSRPAPIRQGSGGLIWPVNGPITSPFCESRAWEACHPGIDIGVPSGTPIRAAAAGRVVLMQPEAASGGYGNFTCIQHTGTMSTCYAHQSRFATLDGRARRAGPGDRLSAAAPAAASARTCTSRCASTGPS